MALSFYRFLRSFWGRFAAGIAAMLAVAALNDAKITWVIDWKLTTAFATAFAAWFASCLPEQGTNSEKGGSAHDRELFDKFQQTIPTEVRHFLRTHDLGGSFRTTLTDGLGEIATSWSGAEFEFDDKNIQKKFALLVAAIRRHFKDVLCQLDAVGDSMMRFPIDDLGTPDQFAQLKIMNERTTELAELVDDFIRATRKRIY